MTSTFFSGRNAAQTSPQSDPTPRSVNAKPPKGHHCVIDNEPAPLEFNPDPAMVMHIHKHKPTANREPGQNVKLARAAAVLDRHADYLEGKGSAPELHEVIAALRLSAEAVRDGIVIGGAA